MERLNKNLYSGCREYPIKIVQFGAGNFMRAFADWMIDRMNVTADFNAGVAVVQPIPTGPGEEINAQDGLYTVYLQGLRDGKAVREHTVVGCIRYSVNPYTDFKSYIKLAETESLQFVLSNTTEAGIVYRAEDKSDDCPPVSFPAKLTVFLYHRYRYFKGDPDKGCIVIPCELIENNGKTLKEILLRYSADWKLGEGFISWLDTANIFCDSLVDRIVPGFPKDTIDDIQRELGYEDSLVTVAEQFYLWVIEAQERVQSEFPAEGAGLNVVFTHDLTPYRTRKVRILNGGHTALVPVAYLLGLDTVGEAVADPLAGRYLREAIFEEIIPTLDLPRPELESFAHSVLERFQNPYVKHYLTSIALNSVSKFRTRVLPSILAYQKRTGTLPQKLVFSLAALMAFYKGKRGETPIPLQDEQPVLAHFEKVWGRYDGTDQGLVALVTETLGKEAFWDSNLNLVDGLTDEVFRYLLSIEKQGMVEAVGQLLS
jgi:tagaturonate reductase